MLLANIPGRSCRFGWDIPIIFCVCLSPDLCSPAVLVGSERRVVDDPREGRAMFSKDLLLSVFSVFSDDSSDSQLNSNASSRCQVRDLSATDARRQPKRRGPPCASMVFPIAPSDSADLRLASQGWALTTICNTNWPSLADARNAGSKIEAS